MEEEVSKTQLCIGGPKAGQHLTTRNDCVSLRVQAKNVVRLVGAQVTVPTPFIVEYREQVLPPFIVWAPVDQTPEQSMRMLVEAYGRCA